MSNTALPPSESRPRTLVTGAVLGSVTIVMFFAGLFAIYFSMRADSNAWGSEWFPEGAIQLVPGGMNMATLSLGDLDIRSCRILLDLQIQQQKMHI